MDMNIPCCDLWCCWFIHWVMTGSEYIIPVWMILYISTSVSVPSTVAYLPFHRVVMLCDAMLCYVMWCDVTWCDVMWCDVMRCVPSKWFTSKWWWWWCSRSRTMVVNHLVFVIRMTFYDHRRELVDKLSVQDNNKWKIGIQYVQYLPTIRATSSLQLGKQAR